MAEEIYPAGDLDRTHGGQQAKDGDSALKAA
jgi:hypothetical protein